ncbi:MAG TPA: phosphate signaling complex protein PhoU [Jatrophihabitantaceae bacterium]|nr:phosphate signaling complex protein PhoU [Jatrophihabitantaceae bacterium]
MRDNFHDELEDTGNRVLDMINLVSVAMQRATNALLDADLALAEQVIGDDDRIDALRVELEDRAFTLIAQQQPVATDLRMLIATTHLAGELERMGDLAHHIAKTARLRYPELAVPAEARPVIGLMAEVAHSLVTKVADVVAGRDVALAQAIEEEDDAMDALLRKLFTVVLSPTWTHGREAAIDVTLVGRNYERYADHAVSVARRTVFIATGRRTVSSTAHPGRAG